MLALLSSPVRRWLLVTLLLLPLIAFALSKLGLYLQRRNGGAPTRLSRALLSVSAFTRRHSGSPDDSTVRDDSNLIASPRPEPESVAAAARPDPAAPQQQPPHPTPPPSPPVIAAPEKKD